jgi:hypothetical protein
MNDDIDFETLLLDNFELVLSLVTRENNNIKTELYVHYAVLKTKLFQRRGRREDLDDAIEKGKYAVAETREEHGAYADRLNNLAVMLESQYKCTGRMEEFQNYHYLLRTSLQK